MKHTILSSTALTLSTAAAVLLTAAAPAFADHHLAKKATLIASMHPTKGNKTTGTVTFTDEGNGTISVLAKIKGLTPNAKHAIHIHEFGDCTSADAKSAGGHFNPEGHEHGLPEKDKRHGGDLGNLSADAKGNASYSLKVKNITLAKGKSAIIGRSVIIHAKADDGGQPTGNAGPRIACGVIGIMNGTVIKHASASEHHGDEGHAVKQATRKAEVTLGKALQVTGNRIDKASGEVSKKAKR